MNTTLPPISDIWVYLSGSPLLALVLTLSAYLLGLTVYERSQRNPLANPVLIAVVVVTLSISVIEATFGTIANRAVTGVGAPSYTSGVHTWNGAAETLNARPIMSNPIPTNNIASVF